MRCSRRIYFLPGAPILALVLLLAAIANRISTATAQTTYAKDTPPGAARQTQDSGSHAPTEAGVWNEAAGALAAKIVEHTVPGNALALSVKNISSLGDDDVAQIRGALRNQLRALRSRLTSSKQAKADVHVTLSENTEGYLWIAEIRTRPSPTAPADESANPVVMVTVQHLNEDSVQPATEALRIRKTTLYRQPEPILDIALLDNPPMGTANPPAPAGGVARILVLGLDSVSLYETAETSPPGGKGRARWSLKELAPLTRLHPWPRDPRGRIIARHDQMFDALLPGVKCQGSTEPYLSLECHESADPWPLAPLARESNSANSATDAQPAAYFTADRNFFDGRIKLDDDHEMKTAPFLAIVAMPLDAATRAGLPPPPGRAPPEVVGAPGWVLTGLDGRAQLLSRTSEAMANVGGWGSQIAGLQSGCGRGWQVLATQVRDLNEADAVQAYEIVNRKPVPVSTPIEFAGPITELWTLADGTEAIAIARNLQTENYEAFRLSITCGE